MSRPVVPVVVPFLDTLPAFLREAVESVFAQTFGAWELHLVDDGSGGASAAAARSLAGRDPDRVQVLDHEGHANRGPSTSRNLGIAEARGAYVAFLDADDVWAAKKLAEQVAILEVRPEAAMVYGRSLYWHSWSPAAEREDWCPSLGVRPDEVIRPPALMPLYLRGLASVPCPCSVMVRRQPIVDLGGFVESARNVYEDQYFYAKVCLELPVYVASRCWDRYRQHSGSQMGTLTPATDRASRRLFLDWLETYLEARGFEDEGVWRALHIERWKLAHPRAGRAIRVADRLAHRGRRLLPVRPE